MAVAQGRPTYQPPPSYHDMLYTVYKRISGQREAYLSLISYAFGAGFAPFISPHYSFFSTIITISLLVSLYHFFLEFSPLFHKIVPSSKALPSYKTFKESDKGIIFRAHLLGILTLFGWYLYKRNSTVQNFGIYLSILAFFHFSEYFFTSISNPQNLGIRSFLLDHSIEYHMASLGAAFEYFFIRWMFPGLKQSSTGLSFFNCLGVLMCLGGETFRKLAMLTCGTNFNHLVEYRDRKDHQLITTGVYGISRHPSYVGWAFWAVGSQLVLGNFICFFGYAYAAFLFFAERIPDEERTLMRKFGDKYADYRKKVPIGLPFIKIE